MPIALPGTAPRLARAAARTAWLMTAGMLTAGVATALEVTVGVPREQGGLVVLSALPARLFDSRLAESLGRGMPATLWLHAELWRQRRGWFDRLEHSSDASVRIRYEVWSQTYRIERPGGQPLVVGSLDSVAAVLERPWALAVGRVGQLAPRARYYVVLSATLRPLTVEDLEEVEGWLAGEVGRRRRSGFGVVTEIPRTLFDTVRNVAGFGDQHARAVSREFTLRDLFPAP